MIESLMELWHWICRTILLKDWFIPLTVVLGGCWAIITLRNSRKSERKNNELLNQPKFEFYDSMTSHKQISNSCDNARGNETVRYTTMPVPSYCGSTQECKALHWFDVKNTGNFPAENISISMILDKESDIEKILQERRYDLRHLQAQESFQYKLDDDSVPMEFYENRNIKHHYTFYILLQYRSGYSKYWYRRVYSLEADNVISIDTITGQLKSEPNDSTSWADSIYFYSITELDGKCIKDINILEKVFANRIIGRDVGKTEKFVKRWPYQSIFIDRLKKTIKRNKLSRKKTINQKSATF